MIISFFCDTNPFCESSAIANRYVGLLKGLSLNGAIINLYILNGYDTMNNSGILSDELNFDNIRAEYCPYNKRKHKSKIGLVKEALFGVHLTFKQEKWVYNKFKVDADCLWLAGGPAFRRLFIKYRKDPPSNMHK